MSGFVEGEEEEEEDGAGGDEGILGFLCSAIALGFGDLGILGILSRHAEYGKKFYDCLVIEISMKNGSIDPWIFSKIVPPTRSLQIRRDL